LMSQGPLMCGEALLREVNHRSFDLSLVRAELLAFLRTIVREQGQGRFSAPISLLRPVAFSGIAAGARVACEVDGKTRDVVIVQLVLLLHTIGLGSVRVCSAGDCQRLFVKTYRREFCSARCQKRVNTRKWRQERAREEQKLRGTRQRRRTAR
jgi:CGNR zinc finger protein